MALSFIAHPACAEEVRVFTNDDLQRYYAPPILNKDTVVSRDQEIRKWERQNHLEIVREKEEQERQRKIEEAKQAAQRDQKQNVGKKRT